VNPLTSTVHKKEREPRFVPYEPYKAAVTPLEATSGARVRIKRKACKSDSEDSHKVEEKVDETTRREMDLLRKELEEKDKQLRIQIQVKKDMKVSSIVLSRSILK